MLARSSSVEKGRESTRVAQVVTPSMALNPLPNGQTSPLLNQFCNNTIRTSKYNVLTFLPKALFEQFRRLANVYFLGISILMLIGTESSLFDSPLSPYSTLFPLMMVLGITIAKEGKEDFNRHQSDKRVNHHPATVLGIDAAKPGQLEPVQYKNVRVGRLVYITNEDQIPADLVLLASSEEGGAAYIETANIDGETNLKIKTAAATGERGSRWDGQNCNSLVELYSCNASIEHELPNARIHNFQGTLRFTPQGGSELEVALNASNLLLRGCVLRNTRWAVGLAVFTGRETKIVQNSRAAPSKLSTIERTVNSMIYLIFFSQFVLTTVSLIAYVAWTRTYTGSINYLCIEVEDSEEVDDNFYELSCDQDSSNTMGDAGYWFTFLILYNNFIPISLYVTIEMVNFTHAFYINEDREMYDAESDTPAKANTSNMNADLGQLEYVFSDKTGTLTCNEMVFKRASVGGNIYGLPLDEQMTSGEEGALEDLRVEPAASRGVASSRLGANAAWDFLLVMAACHTVVVETDEDGTNPHFEAESPDEEALVSAAKRLGVEFVGRAQGRVQLRVNETREIVEYELLATNAFDSTRKRMSCVVRGPGGAIRLLCKGADNIMFGLSAADGGRRAMTEHLQTFAVEGLRTLVLCQREISGQEWADWSKRHHAASVATQGRKEKMDRCAADLEQHMVVVGATAIEDRLQDNVPDTIADLANAGVKLWVLTGDKMETAINIGYSCRLLEHEMQIVKVVTKKEGRAAKAAINKQLTQLIEHFENLVRHEGLWQVVWGAIANLRHVVPGVLGGAGASSSPPPSTQQQHGPAAGAAASEGVGHESKSSSNTDPAPLLDDATASAAEREALNMRLSMEARDTMEGDDREIDFSKLESEQLALIMDGPSLVHVLGDVAAEQKLLKIARICKAVVACRVSPEQKRLLVKLVKEGIRPTPITLAIGDGANDVGMIQEAQVGVGISGKEGRQAVLAADFAIAQFRFLKPLTLVHGRWDYRRIAMVVLYSFYKNVVLTFVLFYFCFVSGFSGQSLYESLVYAGFNWFLGMPILIAGLFDRDVSRPFVDRVQVIYMSGRENMDLGVFVLFQWLLQGILDSLVIFLLPTIVYSFSWNVWDGDDGRADGIYVYGTAVYSCLVVSMMYKVASITNTWTWVNFFFWFGSLALYAIFLVSYSAMQTYAPAFYYVGYVMMQRSDYWLMLLLVPVLTYMAELLVIFVRTNFFDTPVTHARYFDRGFGDGENPEYAAQCLEEIGGPPSEEEEEVRTAAKPEQQRKSQKIRAIARAKVRASRIARRIRNRAANAVNQGRIPFNLDALRALGEMRTDEEKEEMGLPTIGRVESSFVYDHVAAELGPGAGQEQPAGIVGGRRGAGAGVARTAPTTSSLDGGAYETKENESFSRADSKDML